MQVLVPDRERKAKWCISGASSRFSGAVLLFLKSSSIFSHGVFDIRKEVACLASPSTRMRSAVILETAYEVTSQRRHAAADRLVPADLRNGGQYGDISRISVGLPRHLIPPYGVEDNLLVPCIGREAQDNRAYKHTTE